MRSLHSISGEWSLVFARSIFEYYDSAHTGIWIYHCMWAHLYTACHVAFSTDHMMPLETISFLSHMTAMWHKERLFAMFHHAQEICLASIPVQLWVTFQSDTRKRRSLRNFPDEGQPNTGAHTETHAQTSAWKTHNRQPQTTPGTDREWDELTVHVTLASIVLLWCLQLRADYDTDYEFVWLLIAAETFLPHPRNIIDTDHNQHLPRTHSVEKNQCWPRHPTQSLLWLCNLCYDGSKMWWSVMFSTSSLLSTEWAGLLQPSWGLTTPQQINNLFQVFCIKKDLI